MSYYDRDDGNILSDLLTLDFLFLIYKYFTNKRDFWIWLVVSVLILALIFYILIFFKRRRYNSGINNFREDLREMVQKHKTPDSYKNNPTPQATMLYNALMERGIKCETEKNEGHKHIDIAITWAKINIEVDGNQHYTNPKQMNSDMYRDYYSAKNGFTTLHIPNFIIENNLDHVADGIALIARKRYYSRRYKY